MKTGLLKRSIATEALVSCLCIAITACSGATPRKSITGQPELPTTQGLPNEGLFESYLQTDVLPADGFDFPFGDPDGRGSYQDRANGNRYEGWYIATHFAEIYSLGIHPGEDWNGSGGSNTDLGQDVLSVANGRVVFAASCGRLWGNVVVLEHLYYENNQKKKIRSVYAHLNEVKVSQGQQVKRRELIGTIGRDPDELFDAHLHLELRWDESLPPDYWPTTNGKDIHWVKKHYAEPSTFINNHRLLPVPQKETHLILVDQPNYRMRYFEHGKMIGEYQVSFGQESGPKRIEGDKKTPVGMYYVVQKHRGRFDGPYAKYYGGHWIRINYPNKFDALRGLTEGLISAQEQESINKKWEQREATLEDTKLGGGIGFHGWIGEWDNAGPRHLSWGCVVMHLKDIAQLYDRIPEGTMVVIF